MVKLDLCQALQHHRLAFFDTCFTSASCSELEEQTPPANEPAEEVVPANEPAEGVVAGNTRGEEGREDEEPSKPPEPPLAEFSQSKEIRFPSASKHRTKRVSPPLNLQHTLSSACKPRQRENTFQPASSQTKQHESTWSFTQKRSWEQPRSCSQRPRKPSSEITMAKEQGRKIRLAIGLLPE